MKILTVVGARPQFIKAAAISHAISELHPDTLCEDILHTGQHYDDSMSAQFFRELGIPQPRYNLGVGSGSHGAQTAAMLKGIEEVLLSERYDGLMVYGDTNSTIAGALAAAKLHVPVYHVEAGLRSYNRAMPEEVNRVLTDHASDLLFAPTLTAERNLAAEGFDRNTVVFSGDVMLDNVRRYSPAATYDAGGRDYGILATVHRNFNTDSPERLRSIMEALGETAAALGVNILFPAHPRTRKKLSELCAGPLSERIVMVEPLSYLQTLGALKQVRLVLTDSGGLQKEAFFSGKPCVVLRPETEWVEIVECGAATLADPGSGGIADAAERMWRVTPPEPTQFGDGTAARKIVEKIVALR